VAGEAGPGGSGLRPCRTALALFFAPLALGILAGVMVSDHVLAAVERARREQRREAEKRLTRVTSYAEAANAEARWFVWQSAVHGRVLEWVYDGGATANVRN